MLADVTLLLSSCGLILRSLQPRLTPTSKSLGTGSAMVSREGSKMPLDPFQTPDALTHVYSHATRCAVRSRNQHAP